MARVWLACVLGARVGLELKGVGGTCQCKLVIDINQWVDINEYKYHMNHRNFPFINIQPKKRESASKIHQPNGGLPLDFINQMEVRH